MGAATGAAITGAICTGPAASLPGWRLNLHLGFLLRLGRSRGNVPPTLLPWDPQCPVDRVRIHQERHLTSWRPELRGDLDPLTALSSTLATPSSSSSPSSLPKTSCSHCSLQVSHVNQYSFGPLPTGKISNLFSAPSFFLILWIIITKFLS